MWNAHPPRSPDLTPCDFFLWVYLKNKVFTSPSNDLNDLQNRIQNEVDALTNDPALIRRWWSCRRNWRVNSLSSNVNNCQKKINANCDILMINRVVLLLFGVLIRRRGENMRF